MLSILPCSSSPRLPLARPCAAETRTDPVKTRRRAHTYQQGVVTTSAESSTCLCYMTKPLIDRYSLFSPCFLGKPLSLAPTTHHPPPTTASVLFLQPSLVNHCSKSILSYIGVGKDKELSNTSRNGKRKEDTVHTLGRRPNQRPFFLSS